MHVVLEKPIKTVGIINSSLKLSYKIEQGENKQVFSDNSLRLRTAAL
jgi:hypothetical protein